MFDRPSTRPASFRSPRRFVRSTPRLVRPAALLAAFAAAVVGVAPDRSARAAEIEVKAVVLRVVDRVETAARETGMLTEVRVVEGQKVAADELLARIDDEETRLMKLKIELDLKIADRKAADDTALKSAQEESLVAEADLQRAQRSREKLATSVSASELDRLKLRVTQAKLQVEKARHEYEVLKLTRDSRAADIGLVEQNILKRQITAPFAGQVVEVFRRKGDWVNTGDRVFRIIRLDRLRVEGFVDIQHVRPELIGRPVRVKVEPIGGQSRELTGTLTFISPEADPVNRQTRVAAEVDNSKLSLPSGLRATMTILAP